MAQFTLSDLDFILQQIRYAEQHATGTTDPQALLPNSMVPWGLRTLDGTYTNLGDGGLINYGSTGTVIGQLATGTTANSPAAAPADVSDLISDQNESIPNTAPDAGLSAPFNSLMTYFAQFVGHDLVKVAVDENGTSVNATTAFADLSQVYGANSSLNVFLREYVSTAEGVVATGRLLTGADGGLPTWADIKVQARDVLGIELTDTNVPLVATDAYGNIVLGPNGYAQIVTTGGLVEGDPTSPVDSAGATPSGVSFLDEVNPAQLDSHFVSGDGRVNANLGVTALYSVFQAEHNALVEEAKETILSSGDLAFINEWLNTPLAALPAEGAVLDWDGARLFQVAKFGNETQYQSMVFNEFGLKVQPMLDPFLTPIAHDGVVDPAITAEFVSVLKFVDSTYNESFNRLDPNFTSSEIGIVDAFLNPLAYADGGLTAEQKAGAVIRALTRDVANEVDEFVVDALREAGPVDLAAFAIQDGRDADLPSLNDARRAFHQTTGDSSLRAYTSWNDFAAHLRNPESVVNFIAAYGVHLTLTGTLEERYNAALALVTGTNPDGTAFLNGPAADTGVDDIDFWIGGLAEKQMPFGGILGSTFNHVFETQMEAVTYADRLHFVARTAGLDFGDEIANGSLTKLLMAHSDAVHLPADAFVAPGYVLEVDQSRQYNESVAAGEDGILGDDPNTVADESLDDTDGSVDPTGDALLTPLVIRDNPNTPGGDSNYLQYTGADHVVLGGTDDSDTLIASEGDDTLWGDGGNDRQEGGYGNDRIEGGAGNDIITDLGGDDILAGGDGNDFIHGGNGFNVIRGGDGKDFIVTGEDFSEVAAGSGDDFILGTKTNIQMAGNEGSDWIEIGTQDGAPGDNFDPFARDNIPGHDIFIGGAGFDEIIGEGGDDIVVGSDGEDRMEGASGYDWVTYKNDDEGVSVDMRLSAFNEAPLPPSNASVMDRFEETEGLSGSAYNDVLRGNDVDPITIVDHGGTLGSVLTDPSLIDGLQAFLGAGVTQFAGGNIILGGSGSDIIEGRGGDDLIDGDKWLNVRVSVRANPDGTGAEIDSYDSLKDLVPLMLDGTYTAGQLVAVREIKNGNAAFDTAVFSDVRANYVVTTDASGVTTVQHAPGGVPGPDGTDRLTNVERLQFADAVVVLPGASGNAAPVGRLTIQDAATNVVVATPETGQLLQVTNSGITDADGVGGTFAYTWQVETLPGTGVFEDLVDPVTEEPAMGRTFLVTEEVAGLAIRVVGIYSDGHGVLEIVSSTPTQPVVEGDAPPAPGAAVPDPVVTNSGEGLALIKSDLAFILDQIKIAEAHTSGQSLDELLPNSRVPLGLRTVSGEFNNLVNPEFGAADNVFPRETDPNFIAGEAPPPGFGPPNAPATSYEQTSGVVFDSQPRVISNLIVDQTANNPAAYAAAYEAGEDGVLGDDASTTEVDESIDDVLKDGVHIVTSPGLDGLFGTADDKDVFMHTATAADAGLSAPFNSWMTFFGQFFDHGLDLVNKGGSGTIFIPLKPDDPLFVPGSNTNFLVLTRATNQPGPDGILGNADDIHEHTNQTSPFVDQNQTYSSHPSHQVFLRAYEMVNGEPRATGELLENRTLGPNGEFEGGSHIGGMATWAVLKAQARDLLGINLTDADVNNLPLLATDLYGNFIKGSNGFPQVVMRGADGIGGTEDDELLEGDPSAPVSLVNAVRTGHAFLDDIAHNAAPRASNGSLLTPDADEAVNPINAVLTPGTYDNELLDAHYVAGDGRVNENIGLTAVHAVFHSEHNRLVQQNKETIVGSGDLAFINQWLLEPVGTLPTLADLDNLSWNGERLFQAAKFGTEMQYQHLVFEEFARTIQPQIDVFVGPTQVYDIDINPAIVAEFAHTVYRFGHSMLTETIDRPDANFDDMNTVGLIRAFLNPLEYAASGLTPEEATGAIARGLTRQVGNEIDEFVTEALRNNLLGLPLDLATMNLARGRDTGIPSLNAARREFFEETGDTNMKPYTSWADFVQHIKHPESLINFIAAYGTHSTIMNATTLDAKRLAAMNLVFESEGSPLDRLDFLNSTGAWANTAAGVTITGVDAIDFWIGGLAEEIMPFGGMLGSTFNFIFENQMEKLQDSDRFYYLDRTAGLNFLTELEGNSFAKMIMANSDATHLPGLVFQTPGFTLEVDQSKQHTGLGESGPLAGREDPEGDVVRDNPNTDGLDSNYLQYTGDQHVVLGGTFSSDILIGSEGDDTLYGDEGNDRLEGGDGNDTHFGGTGDDIITDTGGDDLIQGGDGNDVIHAGNGVNLVIAGFGNDFVVSGRDASEVFGGGGDDFILGTPTNEQDMGNEGNDWLEGGQSDGAPGDNFHPAGADDVVGHDIYIGSNITDIMNAEGGDDIMVGSAGQGDRYLGASGFDWATFKSDPFGVNVDLTLRAFDETPVPPSGTSVMARFESINGLSGSAHSDILRGDDEDAASMPNSGTTGSVLTNIVLIDGLQELLDQIAGAPVTSFGSGNIILGGDGSDVIEGRGGDDFIDGDSSLNVRISVRANADGTGNEIASYDSMVPLVPLMLNGTYSVGQLKMVREIVTADGSDDFDTALYGGAAANYDFEVLGDGTVVVTDLVGTDGTDRLVNIERLQFADRSELVGVGGLVNGDPEGLVEVGDGISPPVEDQPITVTASLIDPNNITLANPNGEVTGPITFIWQEELVAGSNEFTDILVLTGGAEDGPAQGPSFTPGDDQVGLRLRVKAIYQDADGVIETVFSGPTTEVVNVNDAPTGTVAVSDPTPTEGRALSAVNFFHDADGLEAAVIAYTWQVSTDGASWTNVGTGPSFTPTQAEVLQMLRVAATYTDDQGTEQTVFSAATSPVGDLIVGTAAANTLTGTAFDDEIRGLAGNDTINTGAGNDTIVSVAGQGADTVDGGEDFDTLNASGTAANNTLRVIYDGTSITQVNGGAVSSIEAFTADLLGGIDTLSYAGSSSSVNVDLVAGSASGFQSVTNIENVTGGTGDDTITGSDVSNDINGGAGKDDLSGGGGNDNLVAGAGDDDLSGGLGTDTLNGGGGNDTASYAGETDNMFISLASGQARRSSALAIVEDTLTSIENVIGGAGSDTITGSTAVNVIHAGEGADIVDGGAGNDTIDGEGGNDTIVYVVGQGVDAVDGGEGSDTLTVNGSAANNTLAVVFNGTTLTQVQGGTVNNVETFTADLLGGTDTLTYTGSTAAVSVDLGLNTAVGFQSIANIENATGGSGNDSLTGNAASNTLNGGAGNDTIRGGAGIDTLVGGAGDDTYVIGVGDGPDIITEGAGIANGVDTVRTADNFLLPQNVENLTFTGLGNWSASGNNLANVITGGNAIDQLNGAGGNDTLIGNNGDDVLDGGAGNDSLNGGGGNDSLNVTAGNDTLVYDALGFGADTVIGFDAKATGGQDLIDVRGLELTAASIGTDIVVEVFGADTRVTIGTDTILLQNVTGIGTNAITDQDFIFA